MPKILRHLTAILPLDVFSCCRGGNSDRLRWDLVSAVRAAIRLLEPLLDAVLAEDVLAVRQTERCLLDALGVGDAELVVTDHAGW